MFMMNSSSGRTSTVEGKKLLTEKFAYLHFVVDIVRVCPDHTEATKQQREGKSNIAAMPLLSCINSRQYPQ